jgi:hypothetical protein
MNTNVFTTSQKTIAVFFEGQSGRFFMPQYAKPLTLHRGVSNKIEIQILNEEQKPVDITNNEVIFRAIDSTGSRLLFEKRLTKTLSLKGFVVLTTDVNEIMAIDAQKGYYSLEMNDNPLYTDQNSTGRGELNIVDSILPDFVPSRLITIPTHGPEAANYASSPFPSNGPNQTFSIAYEAFRGNVIIQGSTDNVSPHYYEIANYSYGDDTTLINNTFGYVAEGVHPYLRIEFSNVANGNIGNIWAR